MKEFIILLNMYKEKDMKLHAGSKRNLTLVMDLYELTMSYNYFKQGNKDQYVYFDMYYRKNPDNGGYSIFAGLQQLIACIDRVWFYWGYFFK